MWIENSVDSGPLVVKKATKLKKEYKEKTQKRGNDSDLRLLVRAICRVCVRTRFELVLTLSEVQIFFGGKKRTDRSHMISEQGFKSYPLTTLARCQIIG